MSRYLIVDSRDIQEYTGGAYIMNLTGKLRQKKHDVTLFLIENGVLAARKGSRSAAKLGELSKGGTKVLAEDISCKARGVAVLADGVASGTMDQLADLIVDGSDKVIWY